MDVFLLVIGVLFFAIGLLLANGVRDYIRFESKSSSWPRVKGTVVSSNAVKQISSTRDTDTGQYTEYYYPEIIYSYLVNGEQYTATDPVYDETTGKHGPASKLTAKYPVGLKVSVHYNPKKPTESTIKTRYRGGLILRIVFAAFTLAVGGLSLWGALVGLIRHS